MTLGAGHPMGPLALLDFIGLDVAEAIGDEIGTRVPDRIRALVADGALGKKAGRGLYDVLMELRVHRIPFSTNVERVALAAAHKGIAVEWVDHDAGDRSAIRALSGQDFVPVAELDGQVIVDSPVILRELERARARPAAVAGRARAARRGRRVRRLVQPRLEGRAESDAGQGDAEELRGSLDRFEALLDGRASCSATGSGSPTSSRSRS